MNDSSITPEYLRDQAGRCRRLAEDIADDRARTTLLALADEYEHRAAAMEAEANARFVSCDCSD